MSDSILDIARLEWLAHEMGDAYRHADPFPHAYIDGFLDSDTYRTLSTTFPGVKDADVWRTFRTPAERYKYQCNDFAAIPPALRAAIMEFNSAPFLHFLERLSGIDGLLPDPHLYGGGLHQTLPGGHLGVHIDYNFHEKSRLDRRLNVLFYLNDEWEDSWEGHLQFWDKDVQHCVSKIAPIGNRLAIFNTDEFSWHGHPDPLACPQGKTRRSIALYYYTNGRPEHEAAEAHTSRFKTRPGEKYSMNAVDLLHGITPPYVKALAKRVMGR